MYTILIKKSSLGYIAENKRLGVTAIGLTKTQAVNLCIRGMAIILKDQARILEGVFSKRKRDREAAKKLCQINEI